MARFNSPQSVTVDNRDGAVYVADTGNNCIRKIFNGVVSTYESNFDSPTKICLGANRKLYVTDSAGVKIPLYTPHTQTEYQLYTEGGSYQFNVPSNASNIKIACVSGATARLTYVAVRSLSWIFTITEQVLAIDAVSGDTVWSDNIQDAAGKTLNIQVGRPIVASANLDDNTVNLINNFAYSSCSFGNTIISTNPGLSTIPVGRNEGKGGRLFYARFYRSNDGDGRYYWDEGRYLSKQFSAGAYGGSSSTAGSLFGEAGYIFPPYVNSSNNTLMGEDNRPDARAGAVYIEYTINTPF
jgi:hypothetical protein